MKGHPSWMGTFYSWSDVATVSIHLLYVQFLFRHGLVIFIYCVLDV